MKKMFKIEAGISIGILAIVAAVGFSVFNKDGNTVAVEKYDYEVLQQWKLPNALREISAIEPLDEDRIASVQDEDGSIFIYSLKTSEITNEIIFDEAGDFEGLAINDQDAYVLQSDGVLFEIRNFLEEEPEVMRHETSLTSRNDIDLEGLCVDKSNERLLVAAKHNPGYSDEEKLVFAFNLLSDELEEDPVFRLSMEGPLIKEIDEKTKNKFSPSEIEIDPSTGDLYFLDGRSPKLLIADAKATPQKLYRLNKSEFKQPEGLIINADGSLYISSEGGNGTASIYQVTLNK